MKFTITAVSARLFGLSEGESVKVGLTLSQGGEFAFVLLALAQVLPPPTCLPVVHTFLCVRMRTRTHQVRAKQQ